MTVFADFGPSVTITDIDVAVLEPVQQWLPTFVRSQERISGVSGQVLPASYLTALDELNGLPDTRLPAVVVVTGRTLGDPQRDAGGNYSAAYRLAVFVFVRGINDGDVRRQAALFGGALKRLITTKVASEASVIKEVSWTAERLRPVIDDSSAGRNLAAAELAFTLWVEQIFSDMSGPMEPDPPEDPADPGYEDLPQVTSVDIDVTGIPIESE